MRTLLLFFVIIFFACKKEASDRRCTKFIGDYTTKEVVLNDFDTLELFGKIEYVIVEDSINKAIITAGENMIDFITFENVNKRLTVHNKNMCNFLRSYKKNKIKVEIHYKHINNLLYSGALSLCNLDTIRQTEFRLDSWSGNGDIHLAVNNDILRTYLHTGSADLYLTGKTKWRDLYTYGSSFFYEKNIETNLYRIYHCGTGDYYLGKCTNIELEMIAIGNVYYQGNPNFVGEKITGTGKLIQQND